MTGIATATQPEHASSRRRRMTRAVARRWPTGAAIAGAAASLALWAPLPHQAQTYVSAWCVLLAAVIYLTWGTARGDLARRPLLCAQTVGVLGFGAVAIAAVAATPASAASFSPAAGSATPSGTPCTTAPTGSSPAGTRNLPRLRPDHRCRGARRGLTAQPSNRHPTSEISMNPRHQPMANTSRSSSPMSGNRVTHSADRPRT